MAPLIEAEVKVIYFRQYGGRSSKPRLYIFINMVEDYQSLLANFVVFMDMLLQIATIILTRIMVATH